MKLFHNFFYQNSLKTKIISSLSLVIITTSNFQNCFIDITRHNYRQTFVIVSTCVPLLISILTTSSKPAAAAAWSPRAPSIDNIRPVFQSFMTIYFKHLSILVQKTSSNSKTIQDYEMICLPPFFIFKKHFWLISWHGFQKKKKKYSNLFYLAY